jgi:uncharacterized protein YaaQ
MKLVITIVRDLDADAVTQALTDSDFRVTRTASTGGLLHRGVTTLLVGVENDKVEAAIQNLRAACTAAAHGEKRATIFVVPVDSYKQL